MFSVGLLDVGRSKNARVPVRGALDDAAEAGTAAGPITRCRLFSGATVDDSLRIVGGGGGGSMLVGSGFLVWTAGGGSIVKGAFIFLAAGIGNDDSFLFVSLGGGGP